MPETLPIRFPVVLSKPIYADASWKVQYLLLFGQHRFLPIENLFQIWPRIVFLESDLSCLTAVLFVTEFSDVFLSVSLRA